MITIVLLFIVSTWFLTLCRRQDAPIDDPPRDFYRRRSDKYRSRRNRPPHSRRLRTIDNATLRQLYGDYLHVPPPTPPDNTNVAENGEVNSIEIHDIKVIGSEDAPRGPSPDGSEYYPCYSSPPRYDTMVHMKNEAGPPVCSLKTTQDRFVEGSRPVIPSERSRDSSGIDLLQKMPCIISIHRPIRVISIAKARRLSFKGNYTYKKRSRKHGIRRVFYKIIRSCSESDQSGAHIRTDDFDFSTDSSPSLNSNSYRVGGDGCEGPIYTFSTI